MSLGATRTSRGTTPSPVRDCADSQRSDSHLTPASGARRRVRSRCLPRPRTSRPDDYAVVAAACERLIPAVDGHPGATALGVRRLHRRPARRVPRRPAPDLRRRAVLRPLRRRGRVRRVHAARPARGAGLADPHRGVAGHPRAGAQRPGRRAGSRSTATGIAALGADFPTADRAEQERRLDAVPDVPPAALRARVRRRVRRARVRRQPRRRGLGRDRVPRRRPARAGYTDDEVDGPWRERARALTATRSSSAAGPAGATAADVLTAAGWSVIVLEKGRNHLLDLEPPFAPLGDVSNDEIKFTRRHFLGPDPLLEPRTYRNRADEATTRRRRRGEQPAVDGRRRRLPRRRQAPPLPRGRLQAAERGRAGRRRRPRRLAGRLRRDGAVLRGGGADRRRRGRGRREPVRVVARRPVPDAAGPRHVLRGASRARPRPGSATTRTARRPA